jgi:hypothetical protein
MCAEMMATKTIEATRQPADTSTAALREFMWANQSKSAHVGFEIFSNATSVAGAK